MIKVLIPRKVLRWCIRGGYQFIQVQRDIFFRVKTKIPVISKNGNVGITELFLEIRYPARITNSVTIFRDAIHGWQEQIVWLECMCSRYNNQIPTHQCLGFSLSY